MAAAVLRVATAALLLVVVVGCRSDERVPTMLADGSRASPPGIELQGLSTPAILTRARVTRSTAAAPGSLAAACLRGPARNAKLLGPTVERVGVSVETVTLVAAAGVYGCEDSRGPHEGGWRWCGSSFGRLHAGHLRDPRLDIAGCRTSEGEPIGLAWVEPGRDAHFLVVHEKGYAEVYETAAGLPVRIATVGGVEVEGSRARFHLTEHDADGDLIREYELDAVPAG